MASTADGVSEAAAAAGAVTHYSVNHFAEQLNSLPFAPRSAWQPTAEPVRVPIRSRFELIERGERLLHEPDLPIESDAEEPPPHAAYKSFTPRNLRSCPPGRGQQTPVAVALAKAPRAASRKPPPPPLQQEPSPRWPPRRWPASPSQPLTFVPVPRAKPTAGRDRHQAPAPRQLVTVPSVPLYRLPPPPPPPSSTRVPQPSDDLRPATARGRSGLLKPQSGRPWSAPSRSAPPSRSLAASSCCSGQDWTETVESERGDGFPTSPKANPAAAAEESYLSMLRGQADGEHGAARPDAGQAVGHAADGRRGVRQGSRCRLVADAPWRAEAAKAEPR